MNLGTGAPLGIALLGLLMGMRHATDPDHVIAVTTILSRERRFTTATWIGIVWGLGHTVTVLVVGALIIVFKISIPTRLGLAMEFAVAIVLILLGVSATARFFRRLVLRIIGFSSTAATPSTVHSHLHSHGDGYHRHSHAHSHSDGHDLPDPSDGIPDHDHRLPPETMSTFAARRPRLRAFCVGLVHGLAGSAAIALLVLSAIPQPLWATLYLAIFCIGTIIGMGLITTTIATPFLVAAHRMSWLRQGFITCSGLLSFGFGLFLAYQLGVVDHLFGVVPVWTPH
jgi:ABC-type nickel/cobalt efflux system permease component RcnA